ncbi:MAG: hypothetical protein HPY65_04765 [Syntrophaceae bacterium]|nr:hypothetical protein [Syntrophaceae bacterium]
MFHSGEGETVQIGYVNDNCQKCHGTLFVEGNDKYANVYRLECLHCGYVYGANSGDVWERRCPICQNGAAGIDYWKA